MINDKGILLNHNLWQGNHLNHNQQQGNDFQKSPRLPEWFPGARLNYAENLLRYVFRQRQISFILFWEQKTSICFSHFHFLQTSRPLCNSIVPHNGEVWSGGGEGDHLWPAEGEGQGGDGLLEEVCDVAGDDCSDSDGGELFDCIDRHPNHHQYCDPRPCLSPGWVLGLAIELLATYPTVQRQSLPWRQPQL